MSEIKHEKCNKCRCWRLPEQFINNKGRRLKTCQVCRDRYNKNRKRKKCEHGRQKYRCKDCGGVSICEHGRRRNTCKDCGGSGICEHNKQRHHCKDCSGASICEHDRERSTCKDCKDPRDITFKRWIRNSKQKDKKYNMYDANNFIDYCFLRALVEEDDIPTCIYCSCKLQFIQRKSTLATIERIDNTIGHIKSNCVLACHSCNITRSNRYTFEQFKAKFQ
jgi:hypothetical protein